MRIVEYMQLVTKVEDLLLYSTFYNNKERREYI